MSALAGLCFVVSSSLFWLQGGFGGGHGRFDPILFLLSIPWFPVIEWLPDVIWTRGDYLPIVVLPALFNAASLLSAWTIATFLREENPK